MNACSPWLLNMNAALNQNDLPVVWEKSQNGYELKIVTQGDSLWLISAWPQGSSRMAFRLAYSPNDQLIIKGVEEKEGTLTILIDTVIGHIEVVLELAAVWHWKTTLIPAEPLLFPYWPRDIVHPEITVDNGIISVPDTPGIGYEPDHDQIKALTLHEKVYTC